MAYTPSKTWVSGDVLTASDLQGNLDGVKNYSHNVVAADLKATQWVDTKHIMPGVIDAQTTVTNNCSGLFGGQQHSWQTLNYTFLTRWNTTRSAGTTRYLIIPETSFTIDVGKPATMFYQWWIQGQARDDGYGSAAALSPTVIFASTGGATPTSTHIIPEQAQAVNIVGAPVGINVGVNISGTRYLSGFMIADGTSTSFAVGLRGNSENGQCAIFSWGVSIELFYL